MVQSEKSSEKRKPEKRRKLARNACVFDTQAMLNQVVAEIAHRFLIKNSANTYRQGSRVMEIAKLQFGRICGVSLIVLGLVLRALQFVHYIPPPTHCTAHAVPNQFLTGNY
jgi:hypothetical protein